MKKLSATPVPNPALNAWWRNALTMWEISLAAPQVVAHRSARIARAGSLPNERDRREFVRMGQEKAEAFGESMLAMSLRLFQAQASMAASLLQQWARQSTSLWLMPWAAGSQLASPTLSHRQLDAMMSSLMHLGMAPVHKRVTSNARRLARIAQQAKR